MKFWMGIRSSSVCSLLCAIAYWHLQGHLLCKSPLSSQAEIVQYELANAPFYIEQHKLMIIQVESLMEFYDFFLHLHPHVTAQVMYCNFNKQLHTKNLDVTPSGICGLCKTRAAYIRNSPTSGSNLGRFCRIILPGSTLQYFPSTIGRYAGRGPVPRALFNGRHTPRRAPALRVGYLPLNNALGTGPPPLQDLCRYHVTNLGIMGLPESKPQRKQHLPEILR
jgi:hypothetical protein